MQKLKRKLKEYWLARYGLMEHKQTLIKIAILLPPIVLSLFLMGYILLFPPLGANVELFAKLSIGLFLFSASMPLLNFTKKLSKLIYVGILISLLVFTSFWLISILG